MSLINCTLSAILSISRTFVVWGYSCDQPSLLPLHARPDRKDVGGIRVERTVLGHPVPLQDLNNSI